MKALQAAIQFPELAAFHKDTSKLAHVLQKLLLLYWFFCPRTASRLYSFLPLFPHASFYPLFLSLRPNVAVHQSGHPYLHRMFGDPQGAGSPLLQDPVPHSGRTQHLRALGKSQPASAFSPNHLASPVLVFGRDLSGGFYVEQTWSNEVELGGTTRSRVASSQAYSLLSSKTSGIG